MAHHGIQLRVRRFMFVGIWNPKHLCISVYLYQFPMGAKVLRDLTAFRRLQTFRSCNVCHIVSLCCLVPTRKRWLRSWKISLQRIWRCHLIPSLLLFAVCSLAFLLVGCYIGPSGRMCAARHGLQTRMTWMGGSRGSLKAARISCFRRMAAPKEKRPGPKNCFFLGPACFWVLVFSPILRCDLEWCFFVD